MTSAGLYVKNQTEEFIGNIRIDGYSSSIPISRVVIVDYTRDDKILSTPSNITIHSETEHEKFIGFVKYLRDRKKAAVAKFTNGDRLYFLPPSKVPYTQLDCIFKTQILSSSSLQSSISIKSTPSPSPQPAAANQTAKPSSDFLSTLLDKASTVRAQITSTSSSPPSVLNSTARTILEQFEDTVRHQLSELSSLPEGLSEEKYKIVYPPLEREQRYIIHDVISDYSNLVVLDEGEGLERHMVVYRDGYQPPDDPSIIRPPSGAIIGTKKVKSKSQESTPFIPQPIGSLTKVNQVKRDRRTIEEVQAELKKRKTETENYSEK